MRRIVGLLLLGCVAGGSAEAQSRAFVLRERAEYEAWLRQAPESPLALDLRQTELLSWYPYDGGPVFLSAIQPDRTGAVYQVVSDEGKLMDVTTAGTMTVAIGGVLSRLIVWRLPAPPGGVVEYEVHFTDSTNVEETHPAGRFVTLTELPEGRFLIDFNRARSPFCAYDAARPCPPRAQASAIAAAVRAGERAALYR
ncbi:MAG: DUF1684 domain-containing protein [Gemmatimonadales bacterium]|nr:DUF1684 domain-containing protein [Gemmatimonadales bacterium]